MADQQEGGTEGAPLPAQPRPRERARAGRLTQRHFRGGKTETQEERLAPQAAGPAVWLGSLGPGGALRRRLPRGTRHLAETAQSPGFSPARCRRGAQGPMTGRFGRQVEVCVGTKDSHPKGPRGPGQGTHHGQPQSCPCCEKGHTALRRHPQVRLGEAQEGVFLAASWKTEQQPVEGVRKGARQWSPGEEWNSTQVGVGGQPQDPGHLQGGNLPG